MDQPSSFIPRRPLAPERIAALEAAGFKVHTLTRGPRPFGGRQVTQVFIDEADQIPPAPKARPMGLLDYLELLGERIDRALPTATMLMVIAFLLFIAVIVLSGLAADLAERGR